MAGNCPNIIRMGSTVVSKHQRKFPSERNRNLNEMKELKQEQIYPQKYEYPLFVYTTMTTTDTL